MAAGGDDLYGSLRRSEADLVAQIRQALGGEQFDQAFASGSALSQQGAVAAAMAGPTAAVLPAAGNRPGPAFYRTRAVGHGQIVAQLRSEALSDPGHGL